MKRLLLGVLVVVLLAACSNPFFPALKDKSFEIEENPVTPFISAHPQSAVYTIDAQAVALIVTATKSDNGVLSYQWYSNTANNNTGGTLISGANTASYTPPTDELGTVYYYVIVTNTLNAKTAVATSNTAEIEINEKVNAEVPQITEHPQSAEYVVGDTAITLTVNATVSDVGNLTYQWYSNTVDSNEDGEEIDGETDETFTPPTDTLGTTYYYVVVTNTISDNGDGGNKIATATSETAEIEILTAQALAVKEIAASMITVNVPVGVAFQLGKHLGTASGSDITNFHDITFSKGFSLSKYQVTQRQYEVVMGTNPSYFHGGAGREPAAEEVQGRRPVEAVSWYDALVFCNKLSILAGLTPAYEMQTVADTSVWSTDPDSWGSIPTSSDTRWNAVRLVEVTTTGYRLPTEAQWEYAAKGGMSNENYSYSGGDTVGDVAWYSVNSGSRTHEVGKKAPNGLGLYDMSGNVWEWCWDWFGSYTADAKIDPPGASSGASRVLRGGGWNYSAAGVRSVSRDYFNPDVRSRNIGFRLLRP